MDMIVHLHSREEIYGKPRKDMNRLLQGLKGICGTYFSSISIPKTPIDRWSPKYIYILDFKLSIINIVVFSALVLSRFWTESIRLYNFSKKATWKGDCYTWHNYINFCFLQSLAKWNCNMLTLNHEFCRIMHAFEQVRMETVNLRAKLSLTFR